MLVQERQWWLRRVFESDGYGGFLPSCLEKFGLVCLVLSDSRCFCVLPEEDSKNPRKV